MISYVLLTIILFVLSTVIANPYITLAQKSETQNIFSKISDQTKPDEMLGDDSKILTSKYTPDQINDTIYRLYEDIRNSNNTEIGHNQDIAVLIDLICSNEYYDDIIEAWDIVTELPIELLYYYLMTMKMLCGCD
jgi:hypothetical protein